MIYIIKIDDRELTFKSFEEAKNTAIELGYNSFINNLNDKFYI